MIKVLERLGIHGRHLSIIKTVYSKTIANTNINGDKLKAIYSLTTMDPPAKQILTQRLFNILKLRPFS